MLIGSVRSVQAAKSSSEVVVPKADSLVGGRVSLDLLDHLLLHKAITKNSPAVLSPPLTLFTLLSAARFLLLLVLYWRHNRSTYKRRYSQWERSFLPALWRFNGAAIGFPQADCSAPANAGRIADEGRGREVGAKARAKP